jgi:hypothetical protein
MLFDEHNATVWQSFDHPTNTLLLGQKLVPGQNLTSKGGSFSLSLTSQRLFGYINSNPPQCYCSFSFPNDHNISYVQFMNRSLAFFEVDSLSPILQFLAAVSPLQYMRFEPDGHLRGYSGLWMQEYDALTESLGSECGYPTICCNYGICSDGRCSCPPPINGTSYFRQINDLFPNNGCDLFTPLSCEASKDHILLKLEEISYLDFTADLPSYLNPNL